MQFCFFFFLKKIFSRIFQVDWLQECILTNVELSWKWKDELQTVCKKQIIPRFHSGSSIIFSDFKQMMFYFSLPCTCPQPSSFLKLSNH